IAPGEIVMLTGLGLGPAQLVENHVGSTGLLNSDVGGTQVLFNDIPAPIVYASATQTAAIVPYSISGTATQVPVARHGQKSNGFSVSVVAAAPGLFTLDSSGVGQAAAVNQDGSINTPSTPARVGEVISLFATGEGQTTPPGVDGRPATTPYPQPN